MRLQILGGGNNQLNAIKRAKAMGHEVILADYLDEPPGKAIAHIHEKVSTFSWEENLAVAKKYQVDGIMTTGTDQPVYTVSKVAGLLGLPSFLDEETAIKVTDKRVMKDLLAKNQIPTVPFAYIGADFLPGDEGDVAYPAVLKPLDSQGQRGVFRVENAQQVHANIHETLSYSRQDTAILESFYPSDEVTVSAWVHENETNPLTMTDRKTFARGKHIGICYAHDYPSIFKERYQEEAFHWTRIIQKAFGIRRGPLYIQMLIGEKGLVVNEVACRIGGAYEEIFIPWITGVDILERVIHFSLTGDMGYKPALAPRDCAVTSQLFFANPGVIKTAGNVEEIKKLPGVLDAGYNYGIGDRIGSIENATARAGYMVIEGRDLPELETRVEKAYDQMGLWNEKNENLVIQMKRQRGDRE